MSTGQVTESEHSRYVGIVSNYRSVTDNLTADNNGEITLYTSHASMSHPQWRYYIPPGTKRLYISIVLYISDTEGKMAVAFNRIPTKTANEVNADAVANNNYAKVLETLYNGDELAFYSPPRSGVITVSQPISTDTFMANEGGWLYFNMFEIPGNALLNLQIRTSINATVFNDWKSRVPWNSSGNPPTYIEPDTLNAITPYNIVRPTDNIANTSNRTENAWVLPITMIAHGDIYYWNRTGAGGYFYKTIKTYNMLLDDRNLNVVIDSDLIKFNGTEIVLTDVKPLMPTPVIIKINGVERTIIVHP